MWGVEMEIYRKRTLRSDDPVLFPSQFSLTPLDAVGWCGMDGEDGV